MGQIVEHIRSADILAASKQDACSASQLEFHELLTANSNLKTLYPFPALATYRQLKPQNSNLKTLYPPPALATYRQLKPQNSKLYILPPL